MGCEDLVSHLDVRHGIKVDDDGRTFGASRRNGLLPRQLRPLPRRACSTGSRSAVSTAIASTRSSRRARQDAMSARVFVPADSSALSVGADAVADAIRDEARRRGLDIELVRTGSRGLFWLEPLVEVETAAGRVGYGPVAADEVAQLFEAGFLSGGAHPKALGRVDDIPYLAQQQRLIFARCGLTDPLSLDDYRRHGGLRGLERALALGPKATIEEVLASGLRGRGGAGFPTGIKWRTTAGRRRRSKIRRLQRRRGRQRHLRRPDADGGRPLPSDRGHGHRGASRSARRRATSTSAPNIRTRSRRFSERSSGRGRAGLLGPSVLGSGRAFDLEARLGAGAYICGEETSLLESLEGKRGPDPRQAAAAGDRRPVRQADGHQQCAELRLHAVDPRARREGLCRLRRRTVARIATVPARRQHPLRRARRTRLRRDLARSRRRLRRRHAHRPADPRGSGRRTARRLSSRFAPRYAARLRVDGRGRRHAGPWRHRRLRRQRRHGAPGPLRHRILRQGKLRQVHAVPDRLDPRRRDGRQDHRRPRPRRRTSNSCAIFAR